MVVAVTEQGSGSVALRCQDCRDESALRVWLLALISYLILCTLLKDEVFIRIFVYLHNHSDSPF